jgi:divalent metal cation (Fe/Co/Zn/Cd) transporter
VSAPPPLLPTLRANPASPPPQQPALRGDERDRLIRRAKTLSWLSLAYMTAEGAVAITAAILASSVALLGFGLDSAIEGLASIIVIWRFTGRRRLSAHAEQRARRLVAISFFLLAPYIAQDALRTLIDTQHPRVSWIGIGLSIASIIVMPLVGRAKQRIGLRLGSGATAGEGTQNILCAYLAGGVLVGLALNAAFGLWWADPAVALAIAAIAINEGRETWRGEDCCTDIVTTAQAHNVCHSQQEHDGTRSVRLPA